MSCPSCQQRKLFPPEPDIAPNRFVLEVPLRCHVVIDGDDRIRQCDDIVEEVVADRVVQQEQLAIRSRIGMDGVDAPMQLRRNVLGEDLRIEAGLAEQSLETQHLIGDRISGRRAGVELMDRIEWLHFVATIT